eukprot:8876316-Heterocapsa_arctica.AAC.1
MQDKSKVGMVPFDLDVAVDFVKSVGGEPGEVAEGVADRTPQLPMCDALGDTPDRFEILDALHTMKESCSGSDEVTTNMIKHAGKRMLRQIVLTVQRCWTTDPLDWDDLMKKGIGVMLFKKGDRLKPENYRTIMLLSIISRLISK